MCIDIDLFGHVIVTFSDVELWLENSRFVFDSDPKRVKAYIKNYDIATKIAQSKISGDFYRLEHARNQFDADCIKSAFCQYIEPPEPTSATGCPLTWHRCKNPECEVFKSNKKRDYNRAQYEKKKSQRTAWLSKMSNV